MDSPKLGAFIISFMIVLTFMGTLLFSMLHGVQDNQTVQILMGALVGNFVTVVQYWMGSSSSSKDKDDVIAKQADSNSTAINTAAVTATQTGVKKDA